MPATGKKLINAVEKCVDENLEGFVALNPGLRILKGHRVVIRADIASVKAANQVAVLCGGGSGHEPAHAGFVGRGMLSGSIAGAVFTSPPPNSILAAIRAVANPAGTLLLLNNYTGDRLNFGLALERARAEGLRVSMVILGEDCALSSADRTAGRRGLAAGVLLVVKNYTGDRLNFGIAAERAKSEGLRVDMVVVGEDCALTSTDKTAGRRGLCATIILYKIAGALAEEGRSLEEIVAVCNDAIPNMGTIGLSLSPCSVPGTGPTFQLGEDEMELGLGVHGEAGVRRLKLQSAKEAVTTMIGHMTNPSSSTHLKVKAGDKVALLLNNLGGTSIIEMNIIAREAILYLEKMGVSVERAYSGSFLTSLEMAGLSITVLHLNDTRARALDAVTPVSAWMRPLLPVGESVRRTPTEMDCETPPTTQLELPPTGVKVSAETSALLYKILVNICEALSSQENKLNKLDTESGDGDCGSTLKRGALAIKEKLGSSGSPGLPVAHPQSLILTLACLTEQYMGGSSGGLYSLFLTGAASSFEKDASAQAWLQALRSGIQAISKYGGAEVGDRTMLDPLQAAFEALSASLTSSTPVEAFATAVKAAEDMAEKTAGMKAHAGRASYVDPKHLTSPDPGAMAVAIWMRAAYRACTN